MDSRTHPLKRACGEEWQHERERADKEARQCVDDGNLLEDDAGAVKRGEEGHVLVANVQCVLHKQVWEAVSKLPAGRASAVKHVGMLS